MSNLRELFVVTQIEIAQVRNYYQKSETDLQQDVAILKEWLRQQPHLPHDEDDARLERMFLRNKCRLEQTKKKLDKSYSFKVFYPEMLDMYDVNSARIQDARKSIIIVPLPKLTEKQERVVIIKIINANTFRGLDCVLYILMMAEFCNAYDYSLTDTYIMDWNDLAFNALKTFDLSILHKGAMITMEALSGRMGDVLYINTPMFIDTFLQLMKTVSPKIFAKIKCCPNTESIHKVIPKKMLPIEYGGEEKSIYKLHEEWGKELTYHADVLMELSKRKSNEKLRIGKLNDSDLFGTDGSFKKINLD